MKFIILLNTLVIGSLGAKIKYNNDNAVLSLSLCQPGYAVNASKPKEGCQDVNECKEPGRLSNCTLSHPCVNTPGSYYCNCSAGWTGSWPQCTNINECAPKAPIKHNCSNAKWGIQCNDTQGSYRCECKPGWSPTNVPAGHYANCTEVNECTFGTHNCHAKGNCTNSIGSFSCKCNAGYVGDGVACADMDECVLGNTCHENALCTNTPGSFTCACKVGFFGNGTNCSDINECNSTTHKALIMLQMGNASTNWSVVAGTNTCNNLTGTCTNTYGSYICTCKPGYAGDGKECVNIDECSTNSHTCPDDSVCTDSVGSYSCACKVGYTWKGGSVLSRKCVDLDECWINKLAMGTTTTTTFTKGVGWPFHRNVAPTIPAVTLPVLQDDLVNDEFGLMFMQENSTARVNSSVDRLCHINSTCSNTPGSYTCKCNAGYMGDGRSCVNVNECKLQIHNCDIHASCNDTEGSFTCSCLPGYNGSGTHFSGKWPPIDGCWDTDECRRPLDKWNKTACVKGAKCTNTIGSYSCVCGPGYVGDGQNCTNVNECTLGVHNCHKKASCNETEGSFTCKCFRGWEGNGVSCSSAKTFEVGQFIMKNVTWTQVKFSSPFKKVPVVVVQLPLAGPRETYPRVKEISKTGFKVAIAFQMGVNFTKDDLFTRWINNSLSTLSYIASTVGVQNLTNGTRVSAGYLRPTGQMRHSTACKNELVSYWDTVMFKNHTHRPAFFTQILGVADHKYPGGRMARFCTAISRFNGTKFVNNTNISEAQVARVCDSQLPSVNSQQDELTAWISISINNTMVESEGKNVSFVSLLWTKNITGNNSVEEVAYNGTTFNASPVVVASKATSNQYSVGWMQFSGALMDKALVKMTESKLCESHRKRQEYVSLFAANGTISV
eukprot:TRINITY_DN10103_c0_g1_i1.p1 TRINITY_DN10103_c0_g1~~TRINITY_DN10103_c0_g1_i1.p1  ORF type:complete len:890 (+),score=119.49 TRINITY_DN10103_c0_g1_i1:43-2712(+)